MRLSGFRNRWLGRLLFVALGAGLATAAHAGVRWWEDIEAAERVAGTWAVEGPFGDPQVSTHVCEYRPDGTFWTRATGPDGSLKYASHGRWWVSGRHLCHDYDMTLDGHPKQPRQRPEQLVLIRADAGGMVLAGTAGWQVKYRRQPTAMG
jgi:hypothetical protein